MVFALAGWTVLCNLTVLLGGGLRVLVSASAVFLVVALVLGLRRRASRADEPGATAPQGGPDEAPAENAPTTRMRLIVLALALAWTVAAGSGAATTHLWWSAVLLLSLLAWREFGTPLEAAQPPPSRRAERALLAVGLLFVLQPLLTQRPSIDDGYYLNLAVHAADEPDAPLLAGDTLHGVDGVPLLYSVYRAHSLEVLGGAVAWLTGLSATEACQLVLPALFAAFVAWSWAALLRFLAPRSWPWLLFATLALLLVAREGNQYQGAFTLFRLHQGKAVFAAVLLPLVLLYGMAYGARPGRAAWWRLAAVQVASIGATSTALWAAPFAAVIGLLAGAPRSRRGLARLARGVGASGYVVLLGAYLARDMLAGSAAPLIEPDGVRLVRVVAEPITRADVLVREAWVTVFGGGAFALAALLATLGTWAVTRPAGLRRLAVVAPLVVLLFLANPYAALEVAGRVTGGSTYWRVFWLLPVPLLLGAWLAAPAELARGRGLRAAGVALATVAFIALVPAEREYVSGVRWEPLGLKVPAGEAYAVARHVADAAPAGAHVLAPSGVAAWIVSLHHHPYPLATRPNWMSALGASLGADELARRQLLLRFVTGYAEPTGPAALRDSIDRDALDSVTLVRGGPSSAAGRAVLRARGFVRTFEGETYETWSRPA